MHTIQINGLKLAASIGVYQWEKHITQSIILDIELATDITQAAEHDELNYSIDYTKICSIIRVFLQSRHFNLLETLTFKLVDLLQETFSCKKIKLTVRKPFAIPQATGVAITVERDFIPHA